ncbi:hypothetical protein [Ferrimonas sediminum]|nr:hypothetical protein [Ferrimonas sediminum]
MREATDETVRRCQAFVDTRQGALKETGDLVIPLLHGIITDSDIKADRSTFADKYIQDEPMTSS